MIELRVPLVRDVDALVRAWGGRPPFADVHRLLDDRVRAIAVEKVRIQWSHLDAEDVAQSVWTKLLGTWSRYTWHDGASLTAYVARCAVNACADEARRRRIVEYRTLDDEVARIAPAQMRSVADDAAARADWHTVRTMAEREGWADLLAFAGGASYVEVGAITGRTTSGAKAAIHRQRTRLREVLPWD